MGIAELITMAMKKEGLAEQDCLKKIWMVDSKGLIVKVPQNQHCKRIPEWKEPATCFFGYIRETNVKNNKRKGRRKHQVPQLARVRFVFFSQLEVCVGR